jgi:hypothetical protein
MAPGRFLALLFAVVAATASPSTASTSPAEVPPLPEGNLTTWIVDDPVEVVGYLLLDPATVAGQVPSDLRLVTVEELAAAGIGWAVGHLVESPEHAAWGISFVEIVRAGRFEIDGRSPRWGEDGAAALWFARVAPRDPTVDLGPGRALLALGLWLPDQGFVDLMVRKGYVAAPGQVRLSGTGGDRLIGSVRTGDLRIRCTCQPSKEQTTLGGGGYQTILPAADAGASSIVIVAFAGHVIRDCLDHPAWSIEGRHPLASAFVMQPSTLQTGYHLVGGTYLPEASLPEASRPAAAVLEKKDHSTAR